MNLKDFNTKFFKQSNVVTSYLSSIRTLKAPTKEEEVALFKRIKMGDKTAQDELIHRHQRFVFSVAKRYATSSDDLIDYVDQGNIGLIEAIEKYDPSFGTCFLTYAIHYLRREMNYYKYNCEKAVRQTNISKLRPKIIKIQANFFAENGYLPTAEEMAQILKKEYNVNIKNKCDLYDLSLYSVDYGYNADEEELSSKIVDFNNATASYNTCLKEENDNYNRIQVMALLNTLPQRQQEIIKMLFGIDCEREYSAREIGEKFGVSTSRINMIKQTVLARLRTNYYSNKMAV